MKVFALGGYGKVGLAAVKLLAQSDSITEIAIAGRNQERAEEAATEIGAKAIAVHADGTDEQELTSLLVGYDILMHAALNGTVLPAIRAAIRTGTHYCDANVGNEQPLQLASDAASADITAVIATGICPGISNSMGVHAARQLEEVEQLQQGQAGFINFQNGRELTPQQWLKDPEESLSALHEYRPFLAWMLGIVQKDGTRTVLDYRDGQWVEMNPIRDGLDVPHLESCTITLNPYASCDAFFGGLPGDLAKVSPVLMWFSALPPQLDAVLREQALRVLEEDIDPDTAINAFYDTADSDPHRWLTLPDDYTPVPMGWVRAVGRKDDRAARYNCWFPPAVWTVGGCHLTSVALVVAVLKVLRGEMQERGVMTAEKAFEPLPFFDETASPMPELLPDGKLIRESFEWLE